MDRSEGSKALSSVSVFFLLIIFLELGEVLSSGTFDFPEVGWRVHWIVESELEGVNPPHVWVLTNFFLPWSNELDGPDQWEREHVNELENEKSWANHEEREAEQENL